MATRSQIAFYSDDTRSVEDFETVLYKHNDGYPEDIVSSLLTCLRKKKVENIVSKLGYRITEGLHGDIEFFYAVRSEILEVYSTWCDEEGKMSFNLIETHNVATH